MKLKHKATLIGISGAILLVGFTYGIFYSVFYGYVNTDTKDQMTKDFETVEHLIENEKGNLTLVVRDWAYWDDTYHYIENGNDQYAAANLQEETLAFLNASMMVIVNQNGDILGYKDAGLTPETADALTEKLKQNHFYTDTLTKEEDTKTNLILLNDQAYFVGVALVNNSAHTAASNGAIVFVRPFNKSITDYIESVTGLKITLEEPSTDLIPTELEIRHTEFDGKPYLTSSKLQKDSYGAETISMVISKEESNYSFMKNQFNRFITSFILLIALMLIFINFIMRRCFFVRIEKLINFTNEVAQKKDTSMSIGLPGKDELNILANSTNQMLSEIDSANRNIRTIDERHRLIMEATNDGYLDIWVKKQEANISPAWQERIGYQGKDSHALFEEFISKLNNDFKQRLENCFAGISKEKSDYFEGEYQVVSAEHGVIWVSHRGKVVERDENNQAVRFVSTLSDITLRKNNEEEILFLNYSDSLTLLRNRDYMKKEFEVLYKERNSHYLIIMCDVNGLKITNDTFGPQEGDRVLIAVSNVLRRMCRPTDIISRWSGDEFVILTKDREQKEVCHLIEAITNEIKKIKEFHLNVSIAIGYAESGNDPKNPMEILKMAENRMYRNKLIKSASSHSAVIRSLASTLHEKSCETEEHTKRIQELSKALGNRLDLRKDQLDELELLSLLHDTGKIGIPEYILDKPSKLTDDEWRIIKTHPKIGYRIAKSTPALEHIADDILAHHEKYDGTGYPNGLKGEKIPYLGRIINVVDSFDVMTHSRSYKKASGLSYAITELKQCAGTQFDPEIAKVFLEMIEEGELPIPQDRRD